MELLGFVRLGATSFVLWFVVLFHGCSIGFLEKHSMVDAALTTASWSKWGQWTICNPSHGGRRSRSRNCLGAKGKILSSASCVGPARRTRQCETCAYSLMNLRLSSPYFRQTNSKNAWCSTKTFSAKEYLQVEFKNFVRFNAIGTRGYRGASQAQSGFVTAFKLTFSYNGVQWFPYTNKTGDVIFKGNENTVQLHRNKLEPGFVARYVRVYPTNYHSKPCVSVELYGCEHNCGGLITHDRVQIDAPKAAQQTEEPDCLWRIESKVATKLQLKFPYFNLVCQGSFLQVRDGESPFLGAELHEEFCGGSRKISPLTVTGGDLWLRFLSNATTDDVGFRLHVNAISIERLNSSTGDITVPKTGGQYSHLIRSNWFITGPYNHIIQLKIHYFSSDNLRRVEGKCTGDFLAIYNSSTPSSLIGRYCEANLPKVVNSTGSYLRFKFRARTDNPSWKLRFSYRTLGSRTQLRSTSTLTNPDDFESTIALSVNDNTELPPHEYYTFNRTVNDTLPEVDAARKKKHQTNASRTPVIISSVLAVVIVAVCLVALAHYFIKRKAFTKQPHDYSSRPMSHFGDEDSAPFINTNVSKLNDSSLSSRILGREKSKNGKNSLPFVTITLREDGPQRHSIIPPEMITANSEQSLASAVNGEITAGSLVVSDTFTEECMQLLNNNLGVAVNNVSEKLHGGSEEDVRQEAGKILPEIDEPLPEVSKTLPPEVDDTSPEIDEHL